MAEAKNKLQFIKTNLQKAFAFVRKKYAAWHKRKILPLWLKKVIVKGYYFSRPALICLSVFLFFYYFLGSQLAENIDIQKQYILSKMPTNKLQTTDAAAFLLRREVDDKMWTPNLPPLFPAYMLDNMPNFQIGITEAVRDTTAILRRFEGINAMQYDDLQQAGKMLNYAPNVWLLAKKDAFNLAPSTNTQYRKAAKYLCKFNERADFTPQPQHLQRMLMQFSRKLMHLAKKNEEHVQEHKTDIFDTKADDLFYHHKGYTFALWQISRALGADFKNIIVAHDAYTDWTYLLSSLQKAAEFQPAVVRNGPADALWAPNHLLMQNFYLTRAVVAAERIRSALDKAVGDAN